METLLTTMFPLLQRSAPSAGLRRPVAAAVLLAALVAAAPASAQEQLLFPAVHDAQAAIIQKINNERVRLDVAVWYLGDREISLAIVNKHKSGVPVRVLGDRAAIFEADPNTRIEFEYLAQHGVPIRLRYHPTWFPEIMHWKAGLFVGQNTVEFGSANWTTFELKPWTATNFKDETVMFTDDPALFRAFLTQFDRMWADTTHFEDWPVAYKRETGATWPTPMTISRARLEPDYPNPPEMVWSQGSELNARMAAEIDRETNRIDVVIYRLSDPGITEALLRRREAGVPVRIFVEPLQYRQPDWPEYWLTGARIDQLWVAGAQIRQRVHEGLTHMKTLITSNVALNGSSNFTRNWQRDHNYFIPAGGKPQLYAAMRDRFNTMWADSRHYGPFSPQPPAEPMPRAPANGATGVSSTSRLEWNRTPWAVAFDVYLGTSPGALAYQGRVDAQLVEDPPATYGWTPSQPLQGFTTYYWQVVARTFATDVNPSLVTRSVIRSFTTGAAGLQITSLTSNVPLPATEGTAITWTATTSGGTAPVQYQFWRYTAANGWQLGRDYSTNNTFTWTPPAGTNAIQVWARSAGSTAAYDAYAGSGFFTITSSGARLSSLRSNVAFPVPQGTPITWTATASAGGAQVDYRFWRYSASTGWTVGQEYGPANTHTWTPPAGTHAIQVWVRARGSTAVYDDWTGSGLFEVRGGTARLSSLTADTAFPAPTGTTITWTAVASGSGALEFQYWRYSSATGTWAVARDWNASSQFTWAPGPNEAGDYALQVWVRHVGSGAAWEDWRGTGIFTIVRR